MFYVYVLESTAKKLYFGYTNDLKRRLKEHQKGDSFTTRHDKWELIYYEAYKSTSDARNREKQIKSYGQAWRQLKSRIISSRQNDS
jgi:putative endonuclease